MRLRTAITEHKRRRGERYSTERPTTVGAFTGDGGRLVHVGPDGDAHDCSYALSGVGGTDRVRIGIAGSGGVRWLADLETTRQHYDGDTPLVETEYDAGRYTVHQFDLVVGDAHLTHVVLRGSPPANADLVASCAFAPDMVEGRVGNLVHEGSGPEGGDVIEVFHRREHDFLTASTGLSAAHGQRQETIPQLLGEDDGRTPHRGEIDEREDTSLTPDVVVRAPFERDGRTERVTLVSRPVLDENGPGSGESGDGTRLAEEADRADRLEAVSRIATAHADTDSVREAAEARAPGVPDSVPRASTVASDLRALDLLESASGGRIAGPEFDHFYATSGGYGYTWFRDEAEASSALLAASEELDLDAREDLLASAAFLCRTQDADGSWPHRVWADSGKVAPGWANARIESGDGASPNDQLDQPASVVAFLAELRRTTDVPEPLRSRIDEAIGDAVAFLRETTREDGLPRRCQNCWENAIGRFTHTGAAYLGAFASVARAPLDADLRAAAASAADDAAAGLQSRWIPELERFPQRASDGDGDERADASTFALADALAEYVALAEERPNVAGGDATEADPSLDPIPDAVDLDAFVSQVSTHVRTSIDSLGRETEHVEGLVRFVGDDWRTAEQGGAKVWSIATLWGAVAAGTVGGILESRGDEPEPLFSAARRLYSLCESDGPFANGSGLLAEQVFDDGDLDSATPIAWAHALRLDATATLARHGTLPVPHDRPSGPEAPRWTTGRKFGVGTPADHAEDDPVPVWFTLTEGALTEARFPRIDVMNLRTFDFLIADPETGHTVRTFDETGHVTTTETITRSTEPSAEDALAYRQTIRESGDGHGHSWTLSVEYAVDTAGDAILADVEFEGARAYDVYALADTTLANVGTDDRGSRVGDGPFHLLAHSDRGNRPPGKLVDDDGDPFDVAAALTAGGGFDWASALAAGDDALESLFGSGDRGEASETASGNVVLAGLLGSGTTVSDTVALGFAEQGDTAAALGEAEGALSRGFEAVESAYVDTWRDWLDGREYPDAVSSDPDLEAQYLFALMTLAAVEDKRHDGAGIASPSVPWGETEFAEEDRGYGYNFVWSRDLYQVFTALIEVGEVERGADALAYLYNTQQDDSGFLPQNTYIDGRTRWGGEQMDNIAFPSVMAWQLYEHGVTLSDAEYDYDQVRRSVGYVATNGPQTAQERWEEEAGYSPSSIAAEIAGLTCAAALALAEADRLEADGGDASGAVDAPDSEDDAPDPEDDAPDPEDDAPDPESLRADALAWLALADDWADRVEEWCATDAGTDRHDETPYYIRITADGDPNAGRPRTIANDGPTYDEREIVDGGFLELVRLGVKPADDPVVRNSVAVVDDSIRVDTPHGPAWYRYIGDAYGELGYGDPGGPWAGTGDGKGRLWPIFTGERGEYELRARADGSDAFGGTDEDALEPASLLETMAGFGNEGRMLPEQVWDREHPTDYGWEFGEGTGGATPLAWSMAGFIRLAHGVDAGEPVETPTVVRDRFVERDLPAGPELTATAEFEDDGVVVSGETTGERVAVFTADGSAIATPTDGEFEVRLADDDARTVVVAAASDGDFEAAGTAVERIRL
ncbi:Glucoamylase (glucan-1,4-alpha-glucosidase), GH15 family [Halorubrum aquaticum]|uniref:Glucoamylase (Glucan-1,4-alpha-glucosidase), GH15 family n=1 Tax=Halorubrum aquaticum TaxID=387340 RepID=A0A1I2YXA9_9EURY|nr:glycoside hydrolase family 15 protein [Halorubrum aquaticum]SFH30287.1 Glucoamylase (glucan-1,4-alpha-glucosidase), GH15 family [Halorubrum aquaticum]